MMTIKTYTILVARMSFAEKQGEKTHEILVQQNVDFLRICPGSIISRPQLWTFVNKNQARQLESCDWLTGSRVGTPPELCCQAKWGTPDFYDILIAINLQLRRSNETQLCNKGFRESKNWKQNFCPSVFMQPCKMRCLQPYQCCQDLEYILVKRADVFPMWTASLVLFILLDVHLLKHVTES